MYRASCWQFDFVFSSLSVVELTRTVVSVLTRCSTNGMANTETPATTFAMLITDLTSMVEMRFCSSSPRFGSFHRRLAGIMPSPSQAKPPNHTKPENCQALPSSTHAPTNQARRGKRVCGCVCLWCERLSDRLCGRKRSGLRERVCVCVCMWGEW